MRKLSLKHTKAVSTAELCLHKALSKEPQSTYRDELNEHRELLHEVYWWVLDTIYKPGLNFPEPENGSEPTEQEKGKDDGTEDAGRTD